MRPGEVTELSQRDFPSDFKRLEEVVTALVDRYQRARTEIAGLRRELSARERRLQEQAEQLRLLNQRHTDVAKRLDELIDELDRLDANLAAGAPGGA